MNDQHDMILALFRFEPINHQASTCAEHDDD